MTDLKLDLKLLENLCNAFGPSGHEDEAQKVALEYAKKFGVEVLQDGIGSLIFKKGDGGPKIMIAGHVDEIGFIISNIKKDGYLQFHQLGGWWDQTLLTQEVVIRPSEGDEKIIGVIGAPPPYMLTPEIRNKVVTKEKMYIDIGCSSEKEVKKLGIRVGDPAVPRADFRTMKRTRKEKKNEDAITELDNTVLCLNLDVHGGLIGSNSARVLGPPEHRNKLFSRIFFAQTVNHAQFRADN